MFDNTADDTFFADLPEEEVREALKPPPPWTAGVYDATITAAKPYQGENKEFPCVMLDVTVNNQEGRSQKLRSWVLSKNPKAVVMGLQFLRNVGLRNTEYRNPAQLVGLSGRVRLETIQIGEDEYNNPIERNRIKNFVQPRRNG